VQGSAGVDDLERWLIDGYDQSVRTAYLILGNRADAEDAVQEAYLRAWKYRASLARVTHIKPWLYRVVVNTCSTRLRTEIPQQAQRAEVDDLDSLRAPSDVELRIALSHDVLSAVRDLPFDLRIVVVLKYYADLSEQEIATAIRRPPGTVKSRLHEAKRLLAWHPALASERTDVRHPKEDSRP
jgi:RNA polymerase sigma-70 factor, ECF subfamily